MRSLAEIHLRTTQNTVLVLRVDAAHQATNARLFGDQIVYEHDVVVAKQVARFGQDVARDVENIDELNHEHIRGVELEQALDVLAVGQFGAVILS
jgi:hypothetical protein